MNGFLVKFDIITNYNEWDYLQYIGPESLNEPGELDKTPDGTPKDFTKNPPDFQPTTLPNGKPAIVPIGTIGIIETDLRAYSDFETEGTH